MQMNVSEPETLALSVKAAAKTLNVSTRHIARLIATGELVSFKTGRRRLITTEAMKGFLERMAA